MNEGRCEDSDVRALSNLVRYRRWLTEPVLPVLGEHGVSLRGAGHSIWVRRVTSLFEQGGDFATQGIFPVDMRSWDTDYGDRTRGAVDCWVVRFGAWNEGFALVIRVSGPEWGLWRKDITLMKYGSIPFHPHDSSPTSSAH